MRRLVATALALGCLAPSTSCYQAPPPADVASLVEAERAFARSSVAEGMREAFLRYLGAGAVVFRPHPVPGREWYLERPETPVVLSWEPVYAEVSRDRTLGYTTGPWELKADSAAAPSMFGHYVSVWHRQPYGDWKVLIDVGIVHAPPDSTAPALTLFEPPLKYNRGLRSSDCVPRGLPEARFRLLAANGVASAFDAFASEDIRLYRMNALPIVGKANVLSFLSDETTSTYQPMSVSVSASRDLGLEYGRAETRRGEQTISSYYLMIWRKSSDGTWKIVLDLDSPLPTSEE